MSGICCARWISVASVRPGAPSNVMKRRSRIGNVTPGRTLKKSPAGGTRHCLHRRKRPEHAPAPGADLGAARPNSCDPGDFWLEESFGHRGNDAVEFLFSNPSW